MRKTMGTESVETIYTWIGLAKIKNRQGITLIALVITIIVLLILAGISIIMLVGNNGILENAQKVAVANAYRGAEEQIKLAYASVQTEMMAKKVTDETYDGRTLTNISRLADVAKQDLSGKGWTVKYQGIANEDANKEANKKGVIYIEYKNSNINKGAIDSESTPQIPAEQGFVHYKIVIGIQDANLKTDIDANETAFNNFENGEIIIGIEDDDTGAPTPPTTIIADGVIVKASGGTDEENEIAGYQYSLDGATWSSTISTENGWTIKTTESSSNIIEIEPSSLWNTSIATKTLPETSIIKSETEAKTRVAPIPNGYKQSIYNGETTIEGGLVIYEGTSELSASEQSSALTSRNQFVWIPVDDINEMVMCINNGHTESKTIYARTVNIKGKKSTAYNQNVDLPTICNIVMQQNGNLICKSHNCQELCGRLYSSTDFTKRDQTYNANSGLREPAIITGNDFGTGSMYDAQQSINDENGNTISGRNNILNEFKSKFNNMAKSVAIYGGFYIGRYEASANSNSYACVKGEYVLNEKFYNGWHGLYNRMIKNGQGATSQMIWGCQWDQVMRFVDQKQDGQGNLFDVTVATSARQTGSLANSGAHIADFVQNIYDLEGNCAEDTMEARGNSYRTNRGGIYEYTASWSARCRYKSASSGAWVKTSNGSAGNHKLVTTRPTLYINN